MRKFSTVAAVTASLLFSLMALPVLATAGEDAFVSASPAVANIEAPRPVAPPVTPPVVTLRPDLQIVTADLSANPTTPKAGGTVNLRAIVGNVGTDKAKNFKVRFSVNGQQIYEKTVATLSKNGRSTITRLYTIPVDATGIEFLVTVDPDKTVDDADRKNNEARKAFAVVLATRNLTLESFKGSVTKPKVGQTMTWTVKIRNNGSVKETAIPVALYLDANSSEPTTVITISSLNARAVSTKTFRWTVPAKLSPGTNYVVRAILDPSGAFPETNENDNRMNYTFSLTAPDLSIVINDSSQKMKVVQRGKNIVQTVTISNDNVLAAPSFKVIMYYYTGNNPAARLKLAETGYSGLAKKGKIVDLFMTGKPADNIALGTPVHILVVVDTENSVTETNEANNVAEQVRTMIEPPRQLQGNIMDFHVYGDDGNLLNGATVSIVNPTASTTESRVTGSDPLFAPIGGAVFETRPATATYNLTITAPGYRTRTETINYVAGDEATMYRSYDLDRKSLLTGKVTGPGGAALSGVEVKISGTSLEALTDANGNYGFLLNGGLYTIRFVREGYARIIENNLTVVPLAGATLNKTMAVATTAYIIGNITGDDGEPLANVDVFAGNNIIAVTGANGNFSVNASPGVKNFKFKKPGYVETQFSETVVAGREYSFSFVMYKPVTANHAERGTQIVSWHQHEGTPANAYFIPEYNVDIWWGLGRTKMSLDYTGSGSDTKLTKLIINNHGLNWECNKVEGEGSIETSAIDIPVTIAAGSCSTKQTQMDVYKVSIESDGNEVWSDSSFWSSASDPMNTGTKVFNFNNLPVNWNSEFQVKMWLRVQKRDVVGTDGDGAGALVGYHLDKKLVTWHPQRPPTTTISTSWGQVGNYLLGILDNPVTAVTSFTDLFTVEQYNQYSMSEVLPADFPGAPPAY